MAADKNDVLSGLDVKMKPVSLREMVETTIEWFAIHSTQILVAAAAGIFIYLLLAAARKLGKRLKHKPGEALGLSAVIGGAVARTTHFFMVMASARLVASYASPPALLLSTISFLFIISAAFQAAIWAREIILGLIERRAGEDGQGETLANAMGIIRVLVTFAVFAIAVIVVLDNLGVNVTGLVAGLGIGGIAIGLAAQGIFSDLFAALSIIFDKPFRRGEIISYDTTTARVEKIGLKSTRLRAVTGERKIISNANLLQKEITSLQTLVQRRVTFALGVIYQTPIEVAMGIPDLLRGVVEKEGLTFVHCGMIAFGQSSLDYELAFDVPDPDRQDYFMTRHKMALAVLKAFNDAGIEFAYPTQTTFTSAPDGTMIMPYPPAAQDVTGTKYGETKRGEA
jgi:small-conductance mechanosensitive channel